MTFAEFHNGLRILSSIDRHEVPSLSAEQWFNFRDNPWRFVIQCDDETAEKIFNVVKARSTKASA